MPRAKDQLTTIRTEGSLLPADLLARVSAEDGTLAGMTPASYHRSGERLNEAVSRAWTTLQSAWSHFQTGLAALPAGDLGTTITRERWLLPLFRELDYGRLQTAGRFEIDGKTYPISHSWGLNAPIHLVSAQVDLDKTRRGVAGAATASPHSLLQVFLNRSDDHLWGFVSNGSKLRVLRDNLTLTRQAYVEFDLEAMMNGEAYSDFRVLWLLCHQSRIEADRPSDCWLEQWMKEAEQRGTRALEHLRGGVEEAITALGIGFLEHPANGALREKLRCGRLDKQYYYRQLLRIIYRLLFLFVAEDRDLLLDRAADESARERYKRYYSTQRLRAMAAKFVGARHSDLFEALRLVMRLLGGETEHAAASALGILPLGSFLFSDRAAPDIIDCKLSNRQLLSAIRSLSLIDDREARAWRNVDYKNLGPEELGSVYESLLELHPQINIDARGFALQTAGGNERKTSGSYYTPSSLIKALLDSALEPVLDEAAKQGEDAILNLKICDPATGSGHFLIAAANRIAKRLASLRTGEEEPALPALQAAKRDVIGRCIYGVDINPMAAELCKVSLWLEALDPGKPLSFLDHHIQVGDSLLGATPRLMTEGIPNDAFKLIEGDDKQTLREMRQRNRGELKQRAAGLRQLGLEAAPAADYGFLSASMSDLATAADDSLSDIHAKEALYAALANSPEYIKARLLADAFCAAFVWEKRPGRGLPLTDLVYRHLERDPQAESLAGIREKVVALTDRYRFFHWHVAFPDVFPVPDDLATAENEAAGWNGGFDVVLGNPPWEQIQLDDREFFAVSAPDIANARNMAVRKRMITELAEVDPCLYSCYKDAVRKNDGVKHFVHASGRYPYTSFGRLNTAPLFCESGLNSINSHGFSALIVPTGIATDSFNQHFFNHIVEIGALSSLVDFENRLGLFPDVDSRMKFCLLTLGGELRKANSMQFAFFAHAVSDVDEVKFQLTPNEIRLLNPNTKTTPIFRTHRDAELTKSIYRRVPILIREGEPDENPWGIKFQLMFMMNTDSDKFHTRDQLESRGFTLEGNHLVRGEERYLPLYEAKMMHQFTHRWATYEPDGKTRDMTPAELRDPHALPLPRYWVDEREVEARLEHWDRGWLLGFRDIARTTDERTAIFDIVTRTALGNKVPILLPEESEIYGAQSLVANCSAYSFDFAARQKIGGSTLNFYLVKQLPVIPPHTYTPALLDFITPRVLELTYTAWDLQPFARDLDYGGAPFVWDDERRFRMRCELDALYFHLYGIERADVDYIMETFPIVKRKDEAAHGQFRTKRVILEIYDAMASLPTMRAPAPKPEQGEIELPDVRRWRTPLDPPPADPRAAHDPAR